VTSQGSATTRYRGAIDTQSIVLAELAAERWVTSRSATRSRSCSCAARARAQPPARYLISVSSLNIGRYMEMITMPTITPTPSIMIGSTIEVSDWIEASTSSS
jgi:hypothetical protein